MTLDAEIITVGEMSSKYMTLGKILILRKEGFCAKAEKKKAC